MCLYFENAICRREERDCHEYQIDSSSGVDRVVNPNPMISSLEYI
jgi:hypothetical protein